MEFVLVVEAVTVETSQVDRESNSADGFWKPVSPQAPTFKVKASVLRQREASVQGTGVEPVTVGLSVRRAAIAPTLQTPSVAAIDVAALVMRLMLVGRSMTVTILRQIE
jgi:hypothetical protein